MQTSWFFGFLVAILDVRFWFGQKTPEDLLKQQCYVGVFFVFLNYWSNSIFLDLVVFILENSYWPLLYHLSGTRTFFIASINVLIINIYNADAVSWFVSVQWLKAGTFSN